MSALAELDPKLKYARQGDREIGSTQTEEGWSPGIHWEQMQEHNKRVKARQLKKDRR